MKFLIDTREQMPLEFNHPYISKTIAVKLDVGDIMCIFEDGTWPRIAFERKSVPDIYGTIGKGHKRFQAELDRAKALNVRLILIIEGSFTKVSNGYERSSISGETMIKTLMSLWVRHDLYPVFCKNREEAAEYIYQFYSALGRAKAKKKD